jgi:hypothetical protein
MPSWRGGYQQQRQRIADLAIAEGLSVLVSFRPDAIVPNVPVLARGPARLEHLPRAPFAVAKYYQPLAGNCEVAVDLFSRIVNVPCHPGMAEIGDDELSRFFRALRE